MSNSSEPGHKQKAQYKFYVMLAMIYTILLVASGLLANRLVSVGTIIQAGGTFIFPLTYALGDIIAEVYGYKLARQVIWISLICEILFAFVTNIIIHLPSPSSWSHREAYLIVLAPLPRVVFSAVIGILAGAFFNAYIIVKWKILLNGRYFWLRSIGSSAIGEAILTILVFGIIFIGKMPAASLLTLMISAWLFKLTYSIIMAFPANIVASYLKKAEKADVYDYGTNFNPFRFRA